MKDGLNFAECDFVIADLAEKYTVTLHDIGLKNLKSAPETQDN